MTAARYQVARFDPYGNTLGDLLFKRLDLAYGEQTVGVLDIDIPRGDYKPSDFKVDQLVTVRRSVNYGPFLLEGERAFFIRQWTFTRDTVNLKCFDGNYLIDGRVVLYKSTTAQADKTGPADNLIKAVIRENLGASSAAPRPLSKFTVQDDSGLGPSISKAFSLDKVLPLCQTLSGLAWGAGAYVTFDMVYLNTFTFEFRTFLNQRGVNRTLGGMSGKVEFSESNRNITDLTYTEDHGNEITYVIAAGTGEKLDRAWGEATAAAALSSPWNRRELVADGRTSGDTAVLNADALNVLNQNRAKIRISGTVIQTEGYRYGLDYGYGDLVNVSAYGVIIPCRLPIIHLQVSEKGDEIIDLKLYGEISL